MLRDFVSTLVRASTRSPWLTLACAALVTLALAALASRLEVRADLMDLLPRDSPAFRALEHQMERTGGGAALLVVATSDDHEANRRFVSDLARDLETPPAELRDIIAYVESSTRDVKQFYEGHKWLYAGVAELERVDADIDHAIAVDSGLVSDLEWPTPAPVANAALVPDSAATPHENQAQRTMRTQLERWRSAVRERDPFPFDEFRNASGSAYGLRVITRSTLGDAKGDRVLAYVQSRVRAWQPERYSATLRVGYAGDIAGSADEKRALVSEAVWATLLATVVILTAIAAYFRSVVAVAIVGTPAIVGATVAYAFASATFGYVNATGAFLGAIIVGNGINYPIVLLARFVEYRAAQPVATQARRNESALVTLLTDAVMRAFRAELLGACVASIAYGTLALTQFRAFRQFGAMGFVGMIATWCITIVLVPPLVVLAARWGALRVPAPLPRRVRGVISAFLPPPRLVLAVAALSVAASIALSWRWAHDPWEYDFGKLGSARSDVEGTGHWSNVANDVFGGKGNIAGAAMVADSLAQATLVKRKILATDAASPARERMIDDVATLADLLPGSETEQRAKLAVLASIRDRLSDAVVDTMSEEERALAADFRPPAALSMAQASDLPAFVQRRFSDRAGTLGALFYVKPRGDLVFADGHNHLRLSALTDNVRLDDGTVVRTASRSTIFAEILRCLAHDGPLLGVVALLAVVVVVSAVSRSMRLSAGVLFALLVGTSALVAFAAISGARINYVNFVALPITLGIGCEYPFNVADRVRAGASVRDALASALGPVTLCSLTTTAGYASLLLSDFQALVSFGKLAVVGELACVVAALFVVPAFFAATRRDDHRVKRTAA